MPPNSNGRARIQLPAAIANRLTTKQQVVLEVYINDPNDKHVARDLHLSVQTVRNHIAEIQKRLNVRGRGELLLHVLGPNTHANPLEGRS